MQLQRVSYYHVQNIGNLRKLLAEKLPFMHLLHPVEQPEEFFLTWPIPAWVRLSIPPPPPPCQMPPNGHPLLPNSGRLLAPVSEGCCRVHNANIQGIHVKIQPLFPGEAVLLFEPGGRHFDGVCNTDGADRIRGTERLSTCIWVRVSVWG